MGAPCRIELFGGLRVAQGERVVTRFSTYKTGALLAYLVYHLPRAYPREALAEMFWPDSEPKAARLSLAQALTSLRRQLEPPGISPGAVIVADRFNVRLNPEAVTTDVAEFEAALRSAARSDDPAAKRDWLTRAIELYRGELLPGFYEDWVLEARRWLAERQGQAVQEQQALTQQTAGEKGRRGEGEREGTGSFSPSPRLPFSLSALPSGIVTFLFTDIEGSTRWRQQLGDAAFDRVLETHHALLRAEFRRHGGHEFKETGDGFLVAFARPTDALACAVAAQKAVPLKVRMALHTGEAEQKEGDYHGLVIHHASRMLSAGHGGQILCSSATAGLLRRGLEAGVQLTDIGTYRLRDVPEPERLFQVEYPDMPQREFAPLRAETAYAARLPLQFTRFFGREEELARLTSLLTSEGREREKGRKGEGETEPHSPLLPFSPSPRLVTLTGPGGTGKTRLAIEAAGRLAHAFQGAVWFVALADLTDPRLIASEILDALPLQRSPTVEPLDQVVEFLSGRPSLLLLDNMEHLAEEGAAFLRTLRERVPSLTCLVTSRQRLGLEGEQEFPLPPLPVPVDGSWLMVDGSPSINHQLSTLNYQPSTRFPASPCSWIGRRRRGPISRSRRGTRARWRRCAIVWRASRWRSNWRRPGRRR